MGARSATFSLLFVIGLVHLLWWCGFVESSVFRCSRPRNFIETISILIEKHKLIVDDSHNIVGLDSTYDPLLSQHEPAIEVTTCCSFCTGGGFRFPPKTPSRRSLDRIRCRRRERDGACANGDDTRRAARLDVDRISQGRPGTLRRGFPRDGWYRGDASTNRRRPKTE